ncbi:MAG: stage V sporulation protein AC [Oscillospiraceae bacterium]|nr:stage V sporulation protein AC [Oscillospiraceae bacterium]MBQ7088144.1 stage V sporulation protein AC [Clostridia bacterium]
MNLSNEEYSKLVDRYQTPSPMGKNCVWAFLVGGGICTVAELLIHAFRAAGLDKDTASTVVSVILVFAAALLTGLGIFDSIARFAGAGTLVPITGFANAVAAPALEFKTEGYVTGMAVKLFTVAGPVIVYGISASVVYGVIYWLFTL